MNTQKIDDVNVAALLFRLKFEQWRKAIQQVRKNGKTQFIYFFNSSSIDGKWKLNDVLSAWINEDYVADNPECEISAIKQFVENRTILLAEIKSGKGELVEVSEGGVTAFINPAAPEDKIKTLLS